MSGVVGGPGFYVPGPMEPTFNGSITATGSVQADAATITDGVNVITAGTAGTGVRAKATPTAPFAQEVINTMSVSVNLWPASGAQIDNGAANPAIIIAALGRVTITAASATQWYSS
jgi:hypothetical protein